MILEMIEHKFVVNVEEKLIKHFAKKKFCLFGGAPLNASKHTKTLLGKMFY